MRKFLVIVLASAFLAGCITTGIPKLDNIIDRIQYETAKRCGFVPSIGTVGGVLEILGVTGASAVASTITVVATKVCAAVTKPAAAVRRAAATPGATVAPVVCTANGLRCVPVSGYFVR